MMRRQFHKLKDNHGASMVFALFAFMIAAMISMVIVSAALANVGRVRSLRDEEQLYLTASSAMGIVTDSIDGLVLNATVSGDKAVSGNEADKEFKVYSSGKFTGLQDELVKLANTKSENRTTIENAINITPSGASEPLKGKMSIKMEDDYSLAVTITAGEESSDITPYMINLRSPALYKTSTEIEVDDEGDVKKVSTVSVNWPTDQRSVVSHRSTK